MTGTLQLCVAIGLAFAGVAAGQEKPKDVDGWGKIKWSMTIADVRAAYNAQSQAETNEYWTNVTLDPVKVGDISMKASAGAKHGSERVTQVRLWLSFGLPSDPATAGFHDFDTLRTLLIQKYGSPINEETKREYGDPVKTVLWTFPSTSITLKLDQKASAPNLGTITLQYMATDKKALDVL